VGVNGSWLILIAGLSLGAPGTEDAAPSQLVTGIGRTVDDAKLDARQHALESLQARLATHEPPLTAWQPTLADIERLVQGPGQAGKSLNSLPGAGVHKQWIVQIREMSEEELLQRDRRAAREHRAGVALLAAMTGLALWLAATALRSRASPAA
jgi:hypothetical protein